MLERIKAFWEEWKDTAIGKSVEDFWWNVLYASLVSGGLATYSAVIAGQTDLGAIWGIFLAAVAAAFFKSLSLFRDKWKNASVPNRPQ